MTRKLEGKVAVITGGNSGIGLATAKRFVAEGAYVFITGRRQKELDAAVKEIGSNVTGVQGDVSKVADLDRLYDTVRKQKGKVDVLFANAGVGELTHISEVNEQHFDKIFNVNVRGLLFTVQNALPLLKDGASIILTGSVAGVKGFPHFSVYNATKAAVRSFARSWTSDLKQRRIRVNVVSPGPIDTPILDPMSKETIDSFIASVPLERIGKPEEVASAALFLASDESSYITGVDLFVDGGLAQV
ncbi:MAG TPA: glucose 1-dehydrogenase [Pirellulales bacterium]|nr:glucose 1-dehydrogenase [Pirellulales bacterium]